MKHNEKIGPNMLLAVEMFVQTKTKYVLFIYVNT